MGDAEVPGWLKSLPLAPEYHPTETEFADPIAFISRVEEEAAAFGICKVVPPISKPSKKFVFQNLKRSLSKAPELGSVVDAGSHEHATENAVFTTRHQELGSRRTRLAIHKKVWQSGELYTLEQFEAKSRAFARAHLGGAKGVNPLVVEAMFWKAMYEKPVYIEYANDVPGSGFCLPKEPFRCCSHRTRRPRAKFKKTGRNMVEQPGSMPTAVSGMQDLQPDVSSLCGNEWEGSAGWKLSNSPWNLQVIARTPGSLTCFMPDEVPGVTSPMVYIGMLFSWFAWHVEDHELHSLNFLHTGSPKTWYAVPGSCASEFEEVVRMQGYGGNIDRLAAFTLLGEKTTLLSPEVIAQSGIPCCRLVQHPGEFVVTFPRAYHVGFSHGFNCGEAANFATPKWLKVAKEAAVRRAAMNYLPMLSHQQLLYMLTMSFISRVPRDLLPGVRSSRLRDRKKEEREIMVKKAFLDDLTNELRLVHLLKKDPAFCAVLWHPDLLPSPSNGPQMCSLSRPCAQSGFSVGESKNDVMPFNDQNDSSPDTKWNSFVEKNVHEVTGNTIDVPNENISYVESRKDGLHSDNNATVLELGKIQTSYINDDGDLPCDFDLDSGSLACVACGILGYPFMCIVQPSGDATELFPAECGITVGKVGSLAPTRPSSSSCLVDIITESVDSVDLAVSYPLPVTNMDDSGEDHIMKSLEHETHEIGGAGENSPRRNKAKVYVDEKEQSDMLTESETGMITEVIDINGNNSECPSNSCGECCHETGIDTVDLKSKWNISDRLRPRIFCLQHALDVWDILQSKGGARIVIICHSGRESWMSVSWGTVSHSIDSSCGCKQDFLKIKAYTTSVADDINIQLDCEDVPLKNASKADLDLVYVSIDDEEHEEGGEDWTAKLGLNLRYCVKLRKQCSSNQEQLTLGLGGIFSKQDPVSAFSGLKWHCRKSRTPCRVAAAGRTRSQVAINTKKDKLLIKSPFIGSPAITEAGKSLDRELQPTKRRGRPRKNPSKEMANTTEASASEDQTHVLAPSSSGYMSCTDGEPNDGLCKLLADSSFPSAPRTKDKKVLKQHSVLARKEVKSSFMVGDFAKAEDSARCFIPAQVLADSGGDISDPTMSAECQPSTCNVESSAYHDAGNSVESECQPSIGSLTIRIPDTGRMEFQAGADTITAVGSLNLQHKLTTTKPEEVCNSDILDDQLANSTTVVEGPELWSESAEHTAWRKPEKSTDTDVDKRMEDASSIDMDFSARISGSEVSETNEMPSRREDNYSVKKFDLLQGLKEDGLLKYERRRKKGRQEEQIRSDFNPSLRNKRKREDQIKSVQLSCNGFIRSPCEGLRPRNERAMCEKASNSTKETSQRNRPQRHDDSVGHKDTGSRGMYQCDLQGCHMNFQTRKELGLHKRNRCTYEGCGKRFISHKYAMRHQCVHAVDRPLKCPWKGCNVNFKWAWARTEHVRLHTGERPYKCKVSDCGMTFRFVSDFSRHKRKTGHSPC